MEKGLEEPKFLQGYPVEVHLYLYWCIVKDYFADGACFAHDIVLQGVGVNSANEIAWFGSRTFGA